MIGHRQSPPKSEKNKFKKTKGTSGGLFMLAIQVLIDLARDVQTHFEYQKIKTITKKGVSKKISESYINSQKWISFLEIQDMNRYFWLTKILTVSPDRLLFPDAPKEWFFMFALWK